VGGAVTFDNRGIFGYDISKWQDAPDTAAIVDFNKMKSTGAAFVILRVGQGNFIDREWRKHLTNSRGILPRAAYWFYDPRYDPQLQAAMCTAAIGSERLEGRVWLDLEFDWPGTFHASNHWRTFQDLLKRAGFRTGVYTRQTWWEGRGADMGYWGGEPFWLAQYNNVLDLIPSGLRIPPMLWQDRILTTGREAGVESEEIDRDIWNSQYSFATEWGAQPPETGEPMALPLYGKVSAVVTGTLQIRTGPGANYQDIGDLKAGDHVIASISQNGWWRLSNAFRGSWTGENIRLVDGRTVVERAVASNDVWCSGAYLVTIPGPVVEPDPPAEPADTIIVNVEATITATINGRTYSGVANIEGLELA
jgi:hypothetical protein